MRNLGIFVALLTMTAQSAFAGCGDRTPAPSSMRLSDLEAGFTVTFSHGIQFPPRSRNPAAVYVYGEPYRLLSVTRWSNDSRGVELEDDRRIHRRYCRPFNNDPSRITLVKGANQAMTFAKPYSNNTGQIVLNSQGRFLVCQAETVEDLGMIFGESPFNHESTWDICLPRSQNAINESPSQAARPSSSRSAR